MADLLDEDLGERTGEAWDDALTIERARLLDDLDIGERAVDGGGALLGVNHPDQTGAGVEELPDLLEDVAPPIAGRENLDRQVRRQVQEVVGDAVDSRLAETKLTSGERTSL